MSEERRLVTVLFADAVGSTGLGEMLDPEDVRALMRRYFAIARDVVEMHGGTLEKFIGDAVMAVFGLPMAHGDDATRALAAALELRDRVKEDPQLGERLPIRLGVNSGEVVASREPAGADFLVTGDPVNVAARLQQAAEAWAILVGERTARAAGDGFVLRPIDPVAVRGKALPVSASELIGRASVPRTRGTTLVGREADLAQLELVTSRAFRERRPFLVSVIAAPGVGKSRLLEEFIDRLPDHSPDARVAIAQCLPYGQRLTYWPLRALLLGILELPDETPPDVVRATARSWLAERGDETPDRTADLLAATIGAAELDLVDRAELFAAWRSTIELAATRRPLILVIEDLHWSSDSLLDLVEFVLQPRGASALLMIALARPELLDRRPGWGGGRRNYVSLALEPLDDGEVGELVTQLLDGPAPDIVRSVVARAEGNPFYAGEIVRSIVERVPDLRDRAAVDAALAALPDSVQATVLARLDALSPTARRVLQVASIFGRSYRLSGVASLDPELRELTVETSDELLDRDLIRTSGRGLFTFRHILIREVAYGTLTRTERIRLHAAAGEWIESTAGSDSDALAELIAYHYREAIVLARLVGQPIDDASRRRA
jgi:class 3 adenylate cyclase